MMNVIHWLVTHKVKKPKKIPRPPKDRTPGGVLPLEKRAMGGLEPGDGL